MDIVVGPSATADFVTHANYVTGTTPASTELNVQLAEQYLTPHHSQRGEPTVVSSPNQDTPFIHSLAYIDIGFSASLSLLQLCFLMLMFCNNRDFLKLLIYCFRCHLQESPPT